jgi:hypothetical protein
LPLPTIITLAADELVALRQQTPSRVPRPELDPQSLSAFQREVRLEEVSSDRSGAYLVLVYRGDIAEVIQVVKIK